jgi:hypothetical protein
MSFVKKTVVAVILVLSGSSSGLAQFACKVNLPRDLAVAFLSGPGDRDSFTLKYLPPGDCVYWIRDVSGTGYIEAASDEWSGKQRGYVLRRYVNCNRERCPVPYGGDGGVTRSGSSG